MPSSLRLSPRMNMSGQRRICQRLSWSACGTTTWNSRSTLPWRSATFLKVAVTKAASSTSLATISPSISLTAFMRKNCPPSPSSTLSVSRCGRVRSYSRSEDSLSGSLSPADTSPSRSSLIFPAVPHP